jgi:purine nucleoside phosphorylase
MRVLAGPRLDVFGDPLAAAVCLRLAGEGGSVVSLADLGLENPYRPFSAAEVGTLREALCDEREIVGYVCCGVPAPGVSPGWVAVTDHANLTWRSPLAGPNDERVGPRFPNLAGAYAPGAVLTLGGEQDGMIVAPGVVAGVRYDPALSDHELDMVVRLGWAAASSELVAPVIVAAHMGLRVAAVVKTW